MIVSKIEYDSTRFANHVALLDLRDNVEALVGSVFEIEQSAIDMRMRPYGVDDEFDAPFYFTFCADAKDFRHDIATLTDMLSAQIHDYLEEFFSAGKVVEYSIRVHKESGASIHVK